MSTNLNYKQVANITRRTWDIEAYEKRAQERAKNEAEGGGGNARTGGGAVPSGTAGGSSEPEREEFTPAEAGAAGPQLSQRAFLKARKTKIDSLVDAKVGSVEMINPEAVATMKSIDANGADGVDAASKAVIKSGVGWHCKVCDCFLRDSHTYLDHINGRKHQRNLGYSMRVERSTTSQISSRLAQLAEQQKAKADQKKNQWQIKSSNDAGTSGKVASSYDDDGTDEQDDMYHDMVRSKDEELRRKKEERKRERKERKKLKKKLQNQQGNDDDKSENAAAKSVGGDAAAAAAVDTTEPNPEADDGELEEDDGNGGIDPNLAAMMGFSGFGGGKKNG